MFLRRDFTWRKAPAQYYALLNELLAPPFFHLPGWVRAPKQITDGHLSKLASANGAVLATFDENIPGSYLIPK